MNDWDKLEEEALENVIKEYTNDIAYLEKQISWCLDQFQLHKTERDATVNNRAILMGIIEHRTGKKIDLDKYIEDEGRDTL